MVYADTVSCVAIEDGRDTVPYRSIEDLPAALRAHLPTHAQEIYRGAFNGAWRQYDDRAHAEREEIAHRVAWAAVKHKYEKVGDRWVARAD